MSNAALGIYCIGLGVIYMYLESVWVTLKTAILAEAEGSPPSPQAPTAFRNI